MLRRIVSIALSLALVFSVVPAASAAGASLGRVSGLALTQNGVYLSGQLARVRSLDRGDVAGETTTNNTGEFSFTGLAAGSYVVELVANGYVVATSAPVVLTSRKMTAEGVNATVPAATTQAQAGVLAGSFWASTVGIITIAAVAAGVVAAVVVVKQNASPSR